MSVILLGGRNSRLRFDWPDLEFKQGVDDKARRMMTVLILLEAYTKPTISKKAGFNPKDEHSVWILPGGTEGDEDIDELVAREGVRVLERVSAQEAERCAEEICEKFKRAGVEMKKEFLCND